MMDLFAIFDKLELMDGLRKNHEIDSNIIGNEQHLDHQLQNFDNVRKVDFFPQERMVLNDVLSGLRVVFELQLLFFDVAFDDWIDQTISHVVV